MYFFQKNHILRALQSPRAFDHGPGLGLSPSPKFWPQALQKTRAPSPGQAYSRVSNNGIYQIIIQLGKFLKKPGLLFDTFEILY